MSDVAKWPVRYRKKLIPCSLCDKLTNEPKGVCPACRASHELIRAKRLAFEDNTLTDIYIHRSYWVRFMTVDGERISTSLQELIEALTNQIGRYAHRLVGDERDSIITEGDGLYVRLRVTETQKEILSRFVKVMDARMKEIEHRAYARGSSLLISLAEGGVTIDQINRATTRREQS